MRCQRLTGAVLFCLLTAGPGALLSRDAQAAEVDASASDGSPLLRVFLTGGTSLVSYGEIARLDRSVVFSTPTSSSIESPQLQLVTIPSDRIDWAKTDAYAESARAARYLATRAESDYALLTGEITAALDRVRDASEPVGRLAVIEGARNTLAAWPARHHHYKREDVRQMVGLLDDVIASLRASMGEQQFDLHLVSPMGPPPMPGEPLLAAPTPQEAIQQTLTASTLTASPVERTALLAAALASIDRHRTELPADWATATRARASAAVKREVQLDRSYQALGTQMLGLARARAQTANVQGVRKVLDQIRKRDDALGSARPDAVRAVIADVEEQLDAARRLRLERDRWALRLPELRQYQRAAVPLLRALAAIQPALEDIKALSGSGPGSLTRILDSASRTAKALAVLGPPDELRETHALIQSAAHLAASAARIRTEAALSGNVTRAWDASSAAAGALMLFGRARTDLQMAFHVPQLRQ